MATDRIFNQDHADAWATALRKRPAPVTEADWPEFPQVDSFSPAALNVGFAARIRTRDGAEFGLCLNPVAALHMARSILHMGQEAGWLDDDQNLTAPPLPPLDS